MTEGQSNREEVENILEGIASEIIASDEFQARLRELGPETIRANIERGLAKLDQRAVALAREAVARRNRP